METFLRKTAFKQIQTLDVAPQVDPFLTKFSALLPVCIYPIKDLQAHDTDASLLIVSDRTTNLWLKGLYDLDNFQGSVILSVAVFWRAQPQLPLLHLCPNPVPILLNLLSYLLAMTGLNAQSCTLQVWDFSSPATDASIGTTLAKTSFSVSDPPRATNTSPFKGLLKFCRKRHRGYH